MRIVIAGNGGKAEITENELTVVSGSAITVPDKVLTTLVQN